MKKLGALVVGFGLIASFALADTNTAVSVNAVGYVNKSLLPGGKLELVGVPFNTIGGAATTLEDLIGTNQLTKASSYASADRVMLWNGTGYAAFAIKSNDCRFHNANSAGLWTGAATNPVIVPGMGFWIWSVSSSITTNPVCAAGEVVSSSNLTRNIYQGLNLLSHLFTCDLNVNQSNLTNSDVHADTAYGTADQITWWDATNQRYHMWAMKSSDHQWHYADSAAEWTHGPVSNTIVAGQGFWYRRQTNATLTWVENNPYINNLQQ